MKFVDCNVAIPSFKKIKMYTFKEIPYEMNEVRKYEDYVLKFLSFKLNYFTTFSIMETLMYNGIVFNNELSSHESKIILKEKIKKVNKIAFQILSNFVEDINYVNFNHIEIAFACIVFARECLKFKNIFPCEFEHVYNIKMGNILKCYQYISV